MLCFSFRPIFKIITCLRSIYSISFYLSLPHTQRQNVRMVYCSLNYFPVWFVRVASAFLQCLARGLVFLQSSTFAFFLLLLPIPSSFFFFLLLIFLCLLFFLHLMILCLSFKQPVSCFLERLRIVLILLLLL